jgi:hypothetical protein
MFIFKYPLRCIYTEKLRLRNMFKLDKETNQFVEHKEMNLKIKKAFHQKLPHRTEAEKWSRAY